MIDIKKINSLDKSEFLSIFGNVFEKSKWISEKVFTLKPFESLESLKLREPWGGARGRCRNSKFEL